MIKINRFSIFFVLAVLTVLTAGLNAETIIEETNNPLADVRLGSNGVMFFPKVGYSQLILTVSTPNGEVIRKTFDAGSTPYYDLSGNEGDGSFTYELRIVPYLENKTRESEEAAGLDVIKPLFDEPMVQSGAFFVERGSIVTTAGGVEGGISKPLDVVYADDLIVQGSACIGIDCVNNESFGFDTIRLKENNLRIKFDDTSASAGFPNHDWQLTANDSASGGLNKFSIEDITAARVPFTIEGNAPTNSLYVDDGGRVGFGTATPVLIMHAANGNTPALRLEQNSSSGFSPQTWDLAGNEANFFIRDVTGGSKLPFRIKPGAPTNSLFVASDGKIGFGTASPEFKFEIETTGEDAFLYLDRTDGAQFKLNATTNQTQIGSRSSHKLNFVTGNINRMTIDTTGFIGIGSTSPTYPIVVATANNARLEVSGNWVNPSSRVLKENIRVLSANEAVDALKGLVPVKYNYKVDKTEDYVGFIAEDVPELVAVKDRKGMVTMDVVAVLTRVLQEQQKSLEEQQKIIAELKEKIEKTKKVNSSH